MCRNGEKCADVHSHDNRFTTVSYGTEARYGTRRIEPVSVGTSSGQQDVVATADQKCDTRRTLTWDDKISYVSDVVTPNKIPYPESTRIHGAALQRAEVEVG